MFKIVYMECSKKIVLTANDEVSASDVFEKIAIGGLPCYIANVDEKKPKLLRSANLNMLDVSKKVVEADCAETDNEAKIDALVREASIKIAQWLVSLAESIDKSFSLYADDGLQVNSSICVWYEANLYSTIRRIKERGEYNGHWSISVNFGRKQHYYVYNPEENDDLCFDYEFIKNWPAFKQSILDCLNRKAEKTAAEIEDKLETLNGFEA